MPDNSPVQEATTGPSIPTILDSSTSQAIQLPELGLTLTPTIGHELSYEINNHSAPTLISQALGPSRKRSRSPSSPFYPDATAFSDGKPASETPELNPEDVGRFHQPIVPAAAEMRFRITDKVANNSRTDALRT
ncbi:hypothetical protein Tco_1075653 [Tanacetum coccineum]